MEATTYRTRWLVGRLRVALVPLGLCLLALLAGAPTLAAAAEPLSAPGGFTLRSSNGYSLSVIGSENPKTGQQGVFLLVRGRTSSVTYFTWGTVTDASIAANLGSVGDIDVHYVPSGAVKAERSECGGKSVSFDAGRYEGTIDFDGEKGTARCERRARLER